MSLLIFSRMLTCFLAILSFALTISAEENFLLINGATDEIMLELGPNINERITPCSTFKIALCLMGYDAKILKDEKTPVWDYQEGYDDFLDAWRDPQTPETWMRCSCIWYSKILALQLGLEKIESYLALFEYGNQDMSGGLANPGPTDPTWINSSLKISAKEQVNFIQKMILGKLPISSKIIQMTKGFLFKEELSGGWKFFGKTGYSIVRSEQENLETGWFVGWIEKDHNFFPFAYNIRETEVDPAQRIPRVKQLLIESQIMDEGAE
jgi:beta-lactamase class D